MTKVSFLSTVITSPQCLVSGCCSGSSTGTFEPPTQWATIHVSGPHLTSDAISLVVLMSIFSVYVMGEGNSQFSSHALQKSPIVVQV